MIKYMLVHIYHAMFIYFQKQIANPIADGEKRSPTLSVEAFTGCEQ